MNNNNAYLSIIKDENLLNGTVFLYSYNLIYDISCNSNNCDNNCSNNSSSSSSDCSSDCSNNVIICDISSNTTCCATSERRIYACTSPCYDCSGCTIYSCASFDSFDSYDTEDENLLDNEIARIEKQFIECV